MTLLRTLLIATMLLTLQVMGILSAQATHRQINVLGWRTVEGMTQ